MMYSVGVYLDTEESKSFMKEIFSADDVNPYRSSYDVPLFFSFRKVSMKLKAFLFFEFYEQMQEAITKIHTSK